MNIKKGFAKVLKKVSIWNFDKKISFFTLYNLATTFLL
jgi:hypothetical protein